MRARPSKRRMLAGSATCATAKPTPARPSDTSGPARAMPASRPGPSVFTEPEDDPIAVWNDRNRTLFQRMAGAAGNLIRTPRRGFQDKILDWARAEKAMVEQTGPLPEYTKVYRTETLYAGRTGERLEDLRMDEIEPLVAKMAERGVTREELDQFLYARHAPKRNAYIASILPPFNFS